MAEPTYREIQLSVKQLVFVFMSAVVVAVAIFLLGVSVGRGVDGAPQMADDSGAPAATDTMVTATPPPTEVPPAELTYHDDLQGATPPGGRPSEPQQPDPPGAAGRAGAPPPVTPALPVAPPPPDPDPVDPPATRPAAEPAAPPAGAEGEGQYALQLGAYRARENADRVVSELKQKGYAAYIARPTGSSALFTVRVGPFQDRAQAESMRQRLSRDPKGYESFIIR